tara:strand:+ start:35 stop:352 length:318 start_codon:yes stop_codon:yes gene_type:complete
MRGRAWLAFLAAAVFCALTIGSPHATEIPCLQKDQAKIFEPLEHVRGYGTREGALVKLSVSSEGFWLLTISPPEMNGAVCIVIMGTDWHFVTSAAPKEEARWTAR